MLHFDGPLLAEKRPFTGRLLAWLTALTEKVDLRPKLDFGLLPTKLVFC